MNTRIYWNTIENIQLLKWIEANMPPNTSAVQKVNAAQAAVLAPERQRVINNFTLAKRAMERMQEASTSQVPANTAFRTVLATQSPAVLTLTAAELAKFGAHLAPGTTVTIV